MVRVGFAGYLRRDAHPDSGQVHWRRAEGRYAGSLPHGLSQSLVPPLASMT